MQIMENAFNVLGNIMVSTVRRSVQTVSEGGVVQQLESATLDVKRGITVNSAIPLVPKSVKYVIKMMECV